MLSRIVAVLLFLGCAVLQYLGGSALILGLGAAMAVAACLVILLLDRAVVVARGPYCEYDLAAVEREVCPECGEARTNQTQE
jgi:hypothetical protein